MNAIASPKLTKRVQALAADGLDTTEIAVILCIDEDAVNQVLSNPAPDNARPARTISSLNSAGASAPATFSPGPCGADGGGSRSLPLDPGSEAAAPADGDGPVIPSSSPPPSAPEGPAPCKPPPVVAPRLGRAPGAEPRAMPVSIGTCDSCRVWETKGFTNGHIGRCKRYGPVLAPNPQKEGGRPVTMWPIVHSGEWCGDHVPAEGRLP